QGDPGKVVQHCGIRASRGRNFWQCRAQYHSRSANEKHGPGPDETLRGERASVLPISCRGIQPDEPHELRQSERDIRRCDVRPHSLGEYWAQSPNPVRRQVLFLKEEFSMGLRVTWACFAILLIPHLASAQQYAVGEEGTFSI